MNSLTDGKSALTCKRLLTFHTVVVDLSYECFQVDREGLVPGRGPGVVQHAEHGEQTHALGARVAR